MCCTRPGERPHHEGVIATNSSSGRASAISLSKVQEDAPDLVTLYEAAGDSLRRQGLEGVRAAVYLVLDRSGSMRSYYRDGTMQHLAEQVLSLSAHLDDDGIVPVVFFSTDVDGSTDLTLGRHRTRIDKLHENLGHMGRTNDNEFAFLRKLDTLAVPARRIVDNAGFFHVGRNPRATTDHQLFDRLLQEFPEWLTAARTARVVR
ncbi:VWA domain-containing protein [Streptomyces laculatispora]|uniref:VWA domain-containing protein n=1 Tax=Streptomyces laculatispora TaxID=887464 RepID=A0ABY9IEW6_9ACTN|nr:VWA domain-containing protein [Streptomyces laculatispora]WLQ45139.1 VWA domain-containing protein [Streptomyces laculatispora]